MAGFLVDEDLPRSLVEALSANGFPSIDVRDVGLRSRPDSMIRQYAQAEALTVMTGDLEYGNLLMFPTHPTGTIIVRLSHDLSVTLRIELILKALRGATFDDLKNQVGIIASDGLRLRSVRKA